MCLMQEERPITGYKYTASGRDIFYITLLCKNEKETTVGYYTTDCIVEKIENANTGEILQEITGQAYHCYTYRTGDHIQGEQIHYCHSIQELFDNYHIEKRNGIVQRPSLRTAIQYARKSSEAYRKQRAERLAKTKEAWKKVKEAWQDMKTKE